MALGFFPHHDTENTFKVNIQFIKLFVFNGKAEILNYIDVQIIVAELYTIIKIYI